MKKSMSGFTIVELLIVIVVIAVLASVTALAYNGVQNKAYYSTVQGDLRKAHKMLDIFKLDSVDGKYPVAIAGSLHDALDPIDIKVTTGAYSTVANSNFTYYESDDGTDYALFATVKNGPVLYIKGSDSTIREYVNSPQYPSGSASVHVAAAGLNSANFDNYAAYVGTGGGWRIWD